MAVDAWLLTSPDISSHDIDYVVYLGPGLTWGRILSTCVKSMWSNDIKCKYIFMFPLQILARKELSSNNAEYTTVCFHPNMGKLYADWINRC